MSPGATVSGAIIHRLPPKEAQIEKLNTQNFKDVVPQKIARVADRFTSTFFILGFLNCLIAGYLLVHFLPNFCYQSILSIEEHPWKTLGTGILSLILTPAIVIILFALLIGMSSGMILSAWFAITLYFSRIIFSYWLGARFIQGMQRMAGPSVTLVVGLAIFYLLSAVTYIGPVITILSAIFGFGSIVRNLKTNYLVARSTKIF